MNNIRILNAAAAIATAMIATSALAQTTIGPGGKGTEQVQVYDNAWAGQTFTSPGGSLLSFTFTDTFSGHVSTLFRLATFDGGYFSAPLFERAITLLDGSTTINNIDFATTPGQIYLAYITNGDGKSGYGNVSGGFGETYPKNSYVGGSFYAFQESSPNFAYPYSTRDDYDAAFTATFGDALSAVPEPAVWAMMLAGFGLIGATARRRSSRMVQAI